MVLMSSYSKRTLKEAMTAVDVNLIAPAVTWFHPFMKKKEIQGMSMWFSASSSRYYMEPHNRLIGNRNKGMACFEVQGFYLFHYF